MNKNMSKISRMVIFLIPVCIAINLVGGQLAIMLKLPVFLDAIGTIIAGALCGPVPGMMVGLITHDLSFYGRLCASPCYAKVESAHQNCPWHRAFSRHEPETAGGGVYLVLVF